MPANIANALDALPILVSHYAVAILIILIGVALYTALTPYRELHLLKSGNRSAGIVLAGAILGLALPVAAAMRASLGIFDVLVWGTIAIALQLLTFVVVNAALRGVARHIEADEMGIAIVVAASQIAVGAVNAAATS